MNITAIVAIVLVAVGAILWFTAWRAYRQAGNQWTLPARIRRRLAFIFGSIGAALLLFALLF